MSEMKPCPFCGGDALECKNSQGREMYWVLCRSCHCGPYERRTPEAAITAWNTRPREEALEAEVAVLGAQVRSASEAAQVVWSGEHTRLEAALRPFLALARAVTVDGSPDFVHWAREAKDWTVAFSFAGHSISLGDLRALAALSHPKGADDGC